LFLGLSVLSASPGGRRSEGLRSLATVLDRSAGADSARGSATGGFYPTAVRSLAQLHEALRKLLPVLPPSDFRPN
jgi:hypothetical protein